MSRIPHRLSVLLLGIAVLASGCGRQPNTEAKHGDGHEDAETGGVGFKEGHGLSVNLQVRQALALTTAKAEDHPLADKVRLIAQVFAVSPQVLASATVPAADAGRYTRHAFKEAKLVRMDRSSTDATRLVDLVVALKRTPAPAVGEFVELDFATEPTPVLSVPRAALLETAAGNFVYAVSGQYFLRTPVKVGARSADFVEITDGLHPGDTVVASPVEQLWLAELRLTKGGGHSD